MTFKDRVERHPFTVLATTVLATAAAVAAPMQYFASQRIGLLTQEHELQLQESEAQLASIHRGLGTNEYLDVRSFIHDRNQEGEVRLPTGSRFFSEENFYAASDTPRWKHEETNEPRIVETLSGEKIPPDFAKILKIPSAPVHFWRDPNFTPTTGDPSFVSLGPFVTLQKVPMKELLSLVGKTIDLAKNNEQVGLSEIFVSTENRSKGEVMLAKKKAEDLRSRVIKGEDFAELARQFSDSSTAKQGGELGVFEREDIDKRIADTVFKMKGGEITDVIETKTGYEILKVLYHTIPKLELQTVSQESGPNAFLARMEEKFRGDVTGVYLADQLSVLNAVYDPDFSSEIVRLQKIGNVVYVQFLKTLRNVTVGGRHYAKYFVRQELVIVSDEETLYVIQTYVPTADPSARGEVYSRVTEWFSKLAIFVG